MKKSELVGMIKEEIQKLNESEVDHEREQIIANIEKLDSQLRKDPKNSFIKQQLNTYRRRLDTYERNKIKKQYNVNDVIKIVRKHGLTPTKNLTTGIRGVNRNPPNTYALAKHDPQLIKLYGVDVAVYNKIIDDLTSAGFETSKSSPPGRTVGFGTFASIYIGK